MCLCAILAVSDIHSLKLTILTSHLKIGLNPKRKVYSFPTIRCYRCELLVSGRVYIFPRNLHSFNKSRCRTALWFSIIASLAISTFYRSPICCICNFYVHMHIYICNVHISCRWFVEPLLLCI